MLDEVSILWANEGICKDGEKFSSYSLLSFFWLYYSKRFQLQMTENQLKVAQHTKSLYVNVYRGFICNSP